MKKVFILLIGLAISIAYADSDTVNVDLQTVTCGNGYKITGKSTVSDITKNCNTESLKDKHALLDKNKGQEIKFKATTTVDMECRFDAKGQLTKCKLDD